MNRPAAPLTGWQSLARRALAFAGIGVLLYALLAAMLKNNDQLFSLYVGYDDGSFVQMDDIGGTGRDSRAKLEAPEQAAFRLVVISRSDPARVKSRRLFLSDKLETIRELPGPLDYDPRERPWYKDAHALLTKGGVTPREDSGSWISKAFRGVPQVGQKTG